MKMESDLTALLIVAVIAALMMLSAETVTQVVHEIVLPLLRAILHV